MNQNLSERLRKKTEQDLSEIQKMTQQELLKLRESVSIIVSKEQREIERSIRVLHKRIRRLSLFVLIVTICLLIVTGPAILAMLDTLFPGTILAFRNLILSLS